MQELSRRGELQTKQRGERKRGIKMKHNENEEEANEHGKRERIRRKNPS